jgi:hypothetical protein
MDIALVEMIMDVAGITQSKIQLCEEKKHEEIPQNICKKYNINNQLYSIYRVSQSPNEEIQEHLWSFYQSILYFIKKDYFMLSEESLTKEYERFLVSFKNDIEKMFYIIQQKVEIDISDITNNDFLKILSRYIELKIVIMNNNNIEVYPDEASKNKKIVILEENNVYYPVIDNRFQGYEFINDLRVGIEPTEVEPSVEPKVEPRVEPKVEPSIEPNDKVEPRVEPNANWLRSMPKELLLKTAAEYGIETTKQGKTKVISRTRIELISDILSKK